MQKRGSGLKTIEENIALPRENIQWGRALMGGEPTCLLCERKCTKQTYLLDPEKRDMCLPAYQRAGKMSEIRRGLPLKLREYRG